MVFSCCAMAGQIGRGWSVSSSYVFLEMRKGDTSGQQPLSGRIGLLPNILGFVVLILLLVSVSCDGHLSILMYREPFKESITPGLCS